MHRAGNVLLASLLLMGTAAAAQQKPGAPQHIRGDVVSLTGNALRIQNNAGDTVNVQLPSGTQLAVAERASVSALHDGDYVGTAAVPDANGTLRAVEVHIFPRSMRGVDEGQRPWDLEPGSSMTNATVKGMGTGSSGGSAPSSSMTNATVSKVGNASGGRTLDLQYQGHQATVLVPPGATVVKLQPAAREQVKPGEHVFAIAARQPDGTLVAKRVMIGKGDVVPPM